MTTSMAFSEGETAMTLAGSVVARTALFKSLSANGNGGVTLVSAPAGSGKTILLRAWLDETDLRDRTAWVSVERGEQDAQRFWLSVIEQLRDAVNADAFVETLAPTPRFDDRAMLERLVSELWSLEEPVVLVIDDLHELASPDALAQLELLLARRPKLLRVVLATRRDPQLGLHRLRLAGQLSEIRASDLRFTLEEARKLLVESGVELSDESIAQLHARTEGWAAGLRLAALSLADHPGPEQFVAEFSGSERTVADYLLAEVLERQPEQVRRLLLRTSILERVNGELGDLLTGTPGSEGILHALEQANAFVVALDVARSWFRYHSLFADILRLELRRNESNVVRDLHHAAAEWYVEHGYVVEAVRHAQTSEDWSFAASILADHGFGLGLRGEVATVRTLIDAFPPDVRADPDLIVLSANGPLQRGRLQEVEARLALAEKNASAVPAERRHAFDIKLAAARLVLARRRGDFDSVVGEVESLRGLLEAREPSDAARADAASAVALANLGIAEMWSSMNEESEQHLERGLDLARQIDAPYLEVLCLSHLAVATAGLRPFSLARQRSLEAIAVAEAHGWASEGIVGVAHLQLAALDMLQGRFEDGRYWLERAGEVLRGGVDPAAELYLQLLRGWLCIVEGRDEEALDELRAAMRLQTQLIAPQRLSLPARLFVVQTLLRLGDTASARATLDELTEEDRGKGESRAAFASLHLFDGDAEAALEVVAPILDGTVPASKTSTILCFLLDALARERLDDQGAVEASLERALALAEPDGLVFPFVVTPVHELLVRHPRARTAHAALLSDILDVLGGSSLSAPAGQRPELREDLTESELRVLRYMPSNLSANDIGRELYLSLSTIKTHMRHIYAKLGVHRRTEAVERARELGLLSPSARRR
jgi:LuxR family maltose regulon positive regulatory protein